MARNPQYGGIMQSIIQKIHQAGRTMSFEEFHRFKRQCIRRAWKAEERLIFKLHNTRLELRACPPWRKTEESKLTNRIADLSSRLCLVECIAYLLPV
jgi:hypothetical protein